MGISRWGWGCGWELGWKDEEFWCGCAVEGGRIEEEVVYDSTEEQKEECGESWSVHS